MAEPAEIERTPLMCGGESEIETDDREIENFFESDIKQDSNNGRSNSREHSEASERDGCRMVNAAIQ